MHKRKIELETTESWAGPGNEAKGVACIKMEHLAIDLQQQTP